ncbi:MAG: DNA polymerase III subunit chi [Chiayiivirga sp.]|jgi:DNA polymerase-3 subunit chi|nr:DNA polymerase III subunit chi [Chiayiivirga sp.]
MPRADFYLIDTPRFADQPLRLVCELARRGYDTGQPLLILVRDAAQAEELDDLLWAFDEDAYLPHQIAGSDEDDDLTPILIATPDTATPDRALVLNLRDAAFRGTCERVLEVVPADPAAREPQRARWSEYKARGFETNAHRL